MSVMTSPGSDAATTAPSQGLRLLAGLSAGGPATLAEHRAVHGPLPAVSRARRDAAHHPVVAELLASGLTGRGGAGFPFAHKLLAVAGRRDPLVVVNLSEGEPASLKDAVLATRTPHLVLDGAEASARLVGAREVVLYVHRGDRSAVHCLRAAVAERPAGITWTVVGGPDRYVAGEASAAVRFLSGGPAKPTMVPPHVTQRGVDRRPTLLSNAETYAHVALVVRHGAAWYRRAGTPEESGTVLLTLAGAVAGPGVVEVPFGRRLADVVAEAGGVADEVDAVLVGGYAGTWVPWAQLRDLPVSRMALRAAGADLGVGLLAFLPRDHCGLAETTRLVRWLAGESAGQCGPCVNGLPSLARAFEHLTHAGDPRSPDLLQRWTAQVQGRGACHHPDGVARLVASALRTFGGEVESHVGLRRCTATSAAPYLAVPPACDATDERSWR